MPDPAKSSSRKRERKTPTALMLALAARLSAVQAEMGKSHSQMAELVGVGRTTWTNWVNAENKPEEEAMIRLCSHTAITMEWLYRGKIDTMNLGHAIRLTARVHKIDPDAATPQVLELAS